MNYPKTTTYKDIWLFVALMSLFAMAHEYEHQDSQTRLMNEYWYGE